MSYSILIFTFFFGPLNGSPSVTNVVLVVLVLVLVLVLILAVVVIKFSKY